MEKNSVVSIVRYFILLVVKVKQRIEHSQRFPFNSSEGKQRNMRIVSGEKQRSERSQICHFNSSESKTG